MQPAVRPSGSPGDPPGPSGERSGPEREPRRESRERLERLLALGLPLVALFAAVLGMAALRLGSGGLAGASMVALAYGAAMLVARRAIRGGHVERGAQIAAHGCQAMALAGAVFAPFLYPALAMLPLAAAAIVMPYLEGTRLRAVCVAAVLVEVWIVLGCGYLPPAFDPPPPGLARALTASAVLSVAAVALLLRAIDATHLQRSLRALEAIQARLLEESKRKDEFLAMLGHELRNPLAPILSSVALLRARRSGARELDVIERQTRHVARLLDDLLDVSRITRGRTELRREPVRISDFVACGVEIARPQVDARHHELRVHDDAGPGAFVLGDPVRLAQVVGNLVTNAAKYTAPGGRIGVRTRRVGGRVRISVEDDGRGIPEGMRAKIFELFVQGERSLDRSEGGLGIGLTVVRRLVELHGGSVSVESEGESRGSTFTVSLPALDERSIPVRAPDLRPGEAGLPSPASPEGNRSPSAPRARKKRLLVVDDNVDAAEILADALRAMGHDVRVAHEGEGAIELARAFRPEVVLLDIGLPGMDGFAVARVLLETEPSPRLVALTGYGQASDRARTAAAGFSAHLVKPVDLDRIVELLEPEQRAA